MKKLRSILALVLALVMVFSLAACGKGSDSNKPGQPNKPTETEHPDFVYNAEFVSVPMSNDRGMSTYGVSSEGVYVGWDEKVGENIPEGATLEYEGQYDVYESRIGILGLDGNIKQLENYQPIPAKENTENHKDFYSYGGMNALIPLSDGRLMTLENRSCSWNDAPEGISQDNEEYWNYYQYVRETYIRLLNSDGSEISSSLISMGEDEYLNTYACAVDSEGNLVATNDSGIVAIAPDGSKAYTIESANDSYIDRLVTLKDGTITALTWGEKGIELMPVDLAAKKFGESIALPENSYDLYQGGGDYDLYYNSGINFYGFNITTGESTKILNWMDCDINANSLSNLNIDSEGRIIVLINNWNYSRYSDDNGSSTTELAIVNKVPYESVPQKTVLTLATQGLYDMNTSNAIIKFNRSNDKYRISVKDYSEYNTEDDYSAGLTKLNTEILAGNLPDMLFIDGNMPYEQYAAKGLLEDIYPFIDNDSELSREDLFPTVMGALEVGGKLCQAAASFSLNSVMGAKSVVGDTPGWTYDQFNEALASMPEGCQAFEPYVTRDQILQSCLSLDMEEYVDWTTGECRFDSPEFVKLLQFAASFPAEFDDATYDWETENTRTRIAEGRQMLTSASIYSFDDMLYNDTYFGEQGGTYIGLPTSNGVGNMLSVSSGIAMTKDCADKDGAWQFMRNFLTEKGQKEIETYSLPTNMKVFDMFLAKEMEVEYEKDAEGNFILDENGEKIPVSRGGFGLPDGTTVEIYAITQEQADELKQLINTTTKLADYNDSVFDIVNEQAQAFFAGQKSAEEVAKLIQSKANIYVNEQR